MPDTGVISRQHRQLWCPRNTIERVRAGVFLSKPIRTMTQEEYEKDIAKRQKAHLEKVRSQRTSQPFIACANLECPQCVGTGVKENGEQCIHFTSCQCPRCRTPDMFDIILSALERPSDPNKLRPNA